MPHTRGMADTNEGHDDDDPCRRAWENRLDVRPVIERELERRREPKKQATGFQERIICAIANVHPRTFGRWREGRSRPKQTKRIEDAVRDLGWTSLLDVPCEDPDASPTLGE